MTENQNEQNRQLSVTLPMNVGATLDWKKLVAEAASAVTDFLIKGPADGVARGTSGLLDFATSFKLARSPGYLVWALTLNATAWAFSIAKDLSQDERQAIVSGIKDFLANRRTQYSSSGLVVPLNFFEQPISLQLYQDLRDHVLRLLNLSDEIELQKYRNKIDSGFVFGIFELMSNKSDFYSPLRSALDVPGAKAALFETSWNIYRSKLTYDFEVREIFGQEGKRISLSQLYVPLRGSWKDRSLPSATTDDVPSESVRFLLIDSALDEWLNQSDSEDWLRLLGGGPGSGKSTTLKSLASRVAQYDQYRPMFIPLQNIDLSTDLKRAINSYFVESAGSPFSSPPLAREALENGVPLLLIFDGLDEIAAPGEAAKDVVADFATKLHNLHASLSGASRNHVKVVVSGRMPAFQAANRHLSPPNHGALETVGFLPIQVSSRHHNADDPPIWAEDQRPLWWEKYASALALDPDLPEAFESPRLEGITNEPLLCYLLALSGYASEQWELAADNRNRIYSSLIDSIYARGWGDGTVKRLGPGRTLSNEDFQKLMETIALAAWLGGDARVASFDKFLECVEGMRASDSWDRFTDDNGQDVTNLAMNFYLKSSDRSHHGFEFTHKSFGEYLTSRALLNLAEEVAKDSNRRMDYALADWIKATRTGVPTNEILQFIRDEARLRVSDDPQFATNALDMMRSFSRIVEKIAKDGCPITPTAKTWRELEAEQNNAETAAWMILNSLLIAINQDTSKTIFSDVKWWSENALSSIILRLSVEEDDVIGNYLSYLDASHQIIKNHRFFRRNFYCSKLNDCLFISCTFRGNFTNCDLTGSRFYLCVFDATKFQGTVLHNVTIHASMLRASDFRTAKIKDLRISPFTFISGFSSLGLNKSAKISIMARDEEDLKKVTSGALSYVKRLNNFKVFFKIDLVGDSGRHEY